MCRLPVWPSRVSIFFNAPAVIFIGGNDKMADPEIHIGIAGQNMNMVASSLGLGACWAGYLHLASLRWPPLKAALALPEGHLCMGAMMVGRPKYRYHRLPLRKEPEITWKGALLPVSSCTA